MAIIVLFGQRLLPERSGRTIPADLSKHARTLIEQYTLADGLFQLRVRCEFALLRRAAGQGRSRRLSGPDTGRRSRRPMPAARCGGRRWPRATCSSSAATRGGRASGGRPAPGACGRRSRRPTSTRHAVQPQLRPGRGRDSAALRLDRADRVPWHGHAERRSRGSGRAAPAARTRVRARPCWRLAIRCCCRAPGRRWTSASSDPDILVVDFAGTGSPPGRADGARGQAGDRRAGRHGGAAGHRRGAAGGGGAAGRRCLDPARACSRSSRPTGRSTGRRSSWSAP